MKEQHELWTSFIKYCLLTHENPGKVLPLWQMIGREAWKIQEEARKTLEISGRKEGRKGGKKKPYQSLEWISTMFEPYRNLIRFISVTVSAIPALGAKNRWAKLHLIAKNQIAQIAWSPEMDSSSMTSVGVMKPCLLLSSLWWTRN